jgi:hypothetical protein
MPFKNRYLTIVLYPLGIEFSHGLKKGHGKNRQKNPIAVYMENTIDEIANNKQDKQQYRIVKAKDQMIGVTVFFPDIRQPNEEGEHRKEEEYGERKLGDQGTDKTSGAASQFQDAIGDIKGNFVLERICHAVFGSGILKIVDGIGS